MNKNDDSVDVCIPRDDMIVMMFVRMILKMLIV